MALDLDQIKKVYFWVDMEHIQLEETLTNGTSNGGQYDRNTGRCNYGSMITWSY